MNGKLSSMQTTTTTAKPVLHALDGPLVQVHGLEPSTIGQPPSRPASSRN